MTDPAADKASDLLLETAMDYAAERFNRSADCFPVLTTKQRELILAIMAECYLEGSSNGTKAAREAIREALGGPK